jgi:hypothetical protein
VTLLGALVLCKRDGSLKGIADLSPVPGGVTVVLFFGKLEKLAPVKLDRRIALGVLPFNLGEARVPDLQCEFSA